VLEAAALPSENWSRMGGYGKCLYACSSAIMSVATSHSRSLPSTHVQINVSQSVWLL